MLFRVPLRFMQLYVLRAGFLDGLAGLQICMLSAVMSFPQAGARFGNSTTPCLNPNPEIEADRLAA